MSTTERPIVDVTHTMTVLRDKSLTIPCLALHFTPPASPPFEVRLDLAPIVIGRDSTCDVQVHDHGISQRHCEISLTTSGIRLRDLSSKNGIYVNNLRIVECILPPDVPVTFGHSKLLARIAGNPSKRPLSSANHFGRVYGRSASMRALFFQLERAAAVPAHVVLWGELGTGKRTLAEALHDATPGQTGSFVVLDAKAEDASLIEAVFHECIDRSAGGTLYVHEPTELPRELQTRLARLFQAKRDHTRLVLGMREDPGVALQRQTLVPEFHAPSLSFWSLRILPLRQRKEDILLLVELFMAQHGAMRPRDLPLGTMEMLEGHSWPGNVAQLEDVVEDIVQRAHVGERLLRSLVAANRDEAAEFPAKSLKAAREEIVNAFEKSFVVA
ncbi:MAG TPA: FHA domain-containing protein, partial [Polyangium sp.]|nr:FHA domain-containing protein [Polyangium sp.]